MSLVSSYEVPWGYEEEEVIVVPTVESFTPKGVIVSHNFPTSAEQGVDLPWNADVHNVGTDGQIAIGINNVMGNPGDIVFTFQGVETVIRAGYYFRIYTANPVPNCHHLIESGSVRFVATGSYVVKLWAMWYDVVRNVWVYYSDEEITKYVTVTMAPVWPSTESIHVFDGFLLKCPPLKILNQVTRTFRVYDLEKVLGGKLRYSIKWIAGGSIPAPEAKIYVNDVEYVSTPLQRDVAVIGETDLISIVDPLSIKIQALHTILSTDEITFDVWIDIGYTEPPSAPPKEIFDWWNWLDENKYAVALTATGLIVLYMMIKPTKPTMPIIVIPGVGGKK